MKKLFRRKPLFHLFAILVALSLGVFVFQRVRQNIGVEGYLDPAHRIRYVGGHGEGWDNIFYVEPLWHGNQTTQEGIEYYVQASHQAGEQLLKDGVNQFYVGVTFHNYKSPDEFEEFASRLGIKVTEFSLRATFPQLDPGERVTIFGFPAGDRLIAPEKLERQMKSLRADAQDKRAHRIAVARRKNAKADWQGVSGRDESMGIEVEDGDAIINGVYTFEAITDAEGYRRLLADPHVYHIDVTATLVFQQLHALGVTWDQFVQIPNLGDYDPFWGMETLGLDKFQ